MSLTNFLIFAIPAAVVMVKLAAVSFAVVWLVRGAFEPRSSGSASSVRPIPAAQHSRNPQA